MSRCLSLAMGKAVLALSVHSRAPGCSEPSNGAVLMGKPAVPSTRAAAASPRVSPPHPWDFCPGLCEAQQCQPLQEHNAGAAPATSLQHSGDARMWGPTSPLSPRPALDLEGVLHPPQHPRSLLPTQGRALRFPPAFVCPVHLESKLRGRGCLAVHQ